MGLTFSTTPFFGSFDMASANVVEPTPTYHARPHAEPVIEPVLEDIPELQKFDMSKMINSPATLIIGKRSVGKTVLVKDILYNNCEKLSKGLVISPTDKFCSDDSYSSYKSIVPYELIHESYTPELLQKCFDKQFENLREARIKCKKEDDKENYTKSACIMNKCMSFIVMDDCLYDRGHYWNANFNRLIINGRKYRLSPIIVIPYALPISPDVRTNFDYVYIFRDSCKNNRKYIYDQYLGVFPSFELFSRTMDKYLYGTDDAHNCLVIDNTNMSNKLEDIIFWYTADLHPEFKMPAAPLIDKINIAIY